MSRTVSVQGGQIGFRPPLPPSGSIRRRRRSPTLTATTIPSLPDLTRPCLPGLLPARISCQDPVASPSATSQEHDHSLFSSRAPKLRLPLALTPQLCPVTCYPSRHGKEAQDRTTHRGLKHHLETHITQNGGLTGPFTSSRSAPVSPPPGPDHTIPPPSSSNDPCTPTRQTSAKFSPHGSRSGHEGCPRSVDPLSSGRLDRSHLQDTWAWTDLVSLPKLVLCWERGGRQNNKRSSNGMRRLV